MSELYLDKHTEMGLRRKSQQHQSEQPFIANTGSQTQDSDQTDSGDRWYQEQCQGVVVKGDDDDYGGCPAMEAEFEPCHPSFQNYDEKEENTCIAKLTYLKFCKTRTYLLGGFLCLCTGFIFGLLLYWFQNLRLWLCYSVVESLEEATHVLVQGLSGEKEVVRLYSSDLDSANRDTFLYRFL